MAKIRNIALTTENPAKAAAFYEKAFGMEIIRKSDNGVVFLSDGYINLAILNWKTEKDADVGPNGPNYNGIHHIGFQVDDLDEAIQDLEGANGKQLSTREGLDTAMAPAGPRNVEMKWGGPDDVVIDISQTGWTTSA